MLIGVFVIRERSGHTNKTKDAFLNRRSSFSGRKNTLNLKSKDALKLVYSVVNLHFNRESAVYLAGSMRQQSGGAATDGRV